MARLIKLLLVKRGSRVGGNLPVVLPMELILSAAVLLQTAILSVATLSVARMDPREVDLPRDHPEAADPHSEAVHRTCLLRDTSPDRMVYPSVVLP